MIHIKETECIEILILSRCGEKTKSSRGMQFIWCKIFEKTNPLLVKSRRNLEHIKHIPNAVLPKINRNLKLKIVLSTLIAPRNKIQQITKFLKNRWECTCRMSMMTITITAKSTVKLCRVGVSNFRRKIVKYYIMWL